MSIKKYIKTENVFLFIIIVFIFVFAIQLPGDPDMGWHLKNGEYLINNHFAFPEVDQYSYTMPNFPVIMHEWLTDVMMYFFYNNFGLVGLTIIFSLISLAAFYIAVRSFKSTLSYQLVACLLGIIAALPIISIRPQMITLLGLAIIIYIINKYQQDQGTKLIYYLPLIFLFWVNLHGGFSIGLFFIFLFLAIELLKILIKKINQKRRILPLMISNYKVYKIKDLLKLGAIFLAAILATYINPYGLKIYYEVFTTIFDTYAKAFINEWAPLNISNPMSHRFVIYAFLYAILLLIGYKRINFNYFIISVVFFIISVSSWRHLPFFLLISAPYWVYLIENLVGKILLNLFKQQWLIVVLLLALVVLINQKMLPLIKVINSPELIAAVFGYPYQAVKFLNENSIGERIFNDYNWGGYLIWQHPQKKVFIDGRMASWRQILPNGKSQEILKEFQIIRNAETGWEEYLNAYQADHALIYSDTLLARTLEKNGWQIVYRDNLATILKK